MAHNIVVYEVARARAKLEKLKDIRRLLGLGVCPGHNGIHLVIAEDHRNGQEHREWPHKPGYRYVVWMRSTRAKPCIARVERGADTHPFLGELLLTACLHFKRPDRRLDCALMVQSGARRRRVEVELKGDVVPARKHPRKRIQGKGGGYNGHLEK